MLRSAIGVGLLVVVVGLGCKAKVDQAHSDGDAAQSGARAAAGADSPSAAGTKVDWQKIERVPFAKLQTLLPATIADMKRTGLEGTTVPDGEATFSQASASYEGPAESTLQLEIQDNPVTARELLGSRSTTFKGYPVVVESETEDEADVKIIVGDRFIVRGYAVKRKVAQVKTAFESVDLAKLASWKLEGMPK